MIEPILDDSGPFSGVLQTLVEARVDSIVNRLVVSHHNGQITAQEALSGVAEIAALRGLVSDLTRRIRNSK